MNILITPAFKLANSEMIELSKQHNLYFIEDERVPLSSLKIGFDPEIIECIICNFFFLSNSVDLFPNLRIVQLTSAGLDRIPLSELKKRNIKVFNAQDAYAIPMAEWVISKILDMYKKSCFFYKNQELHKWEKNRRIRELYGSEVTIIGYGNVGKQIAQRLKPFGVTIKIVDLFQIDSAIIDKWYPVTEVEKAIAEADIIILSLPLTEDTHHIVNYDFLSKCKDNTIIVNISRGGLVDEEVLIEFLSTGRISGAVLDVFEQEPLDENSKLWNIKNIIISPHNSFVGDGNRKRLYEIVKKNIGE